MAGRRMSKRRIIRRSCEFGCMARALCPGAQYYQKSTRQTADVPSAKAEFRNRDGPVALQCIETSAVCNSKMRFGTDSVNLFGFRNRLSFREPREDARMRMAH